MMAIIGMAACNSESETKTEESAPNVPAIQNVNGNIPDTTNTINLNGPTSIDSSRIKDDSLRK